MGFNKNNNIDKSSYFNQLKDLNPELAGKIIDKEHENTKLGILGIFFGSNEYTSTHIMGILTIILLILFLVIIFCNKDTEALKYINGLIGICIGYIAGKK